MLSIGVKELLEAGVHFGHQTKRWNPKMKQFIFEARNGIHVIDLSKTLPQLETACEFLGQLAGKGGNILKQIDTKHYPNGSAQAIQDQQKREASMAASMS